MRLHLAVGVQVIPGHFKWVRHFVLGILERAYSIVINTDQSLVEALSQRQNEQQKLDKQAFSQIEQAQEQRVIFQEAMTNLDCLGNKRDLDDKVHGLAVDHGPIVEDVVTHGIGSETKRDLVGHRPPKVSVRRCAARMILTIVLSLVRQANNIVYLTFYALHSNLSGPIFDEPMYRATVHALARRLLTFNRA